MGLDAYIRISSEDDEPTKTEELGYFRKVNWLHNYMHQLHCKKYGDIPAEDYNCIATNLELDDLIQLQKDIVRNNIKPVSGFFFGVEEVREYDVENVLVVIAKAIAQLRNGNKIEYTSWW